MTFRNTLAAMLVLGVLCSFALSQKEKPVFYLVGDSTVRNGDGTGKGGLWGWGSFLSDCLDTAGITVENHATGGRSSRTFITEGRWQKVLSQLKKGDYVAVQFGHNDSGPLDDTARARGTLKGTGDESKEIYNPIRKTQEVVYTYGHYLRRYIRDAKRKGATVIVCSPVPRNAWKRDSVVRSAESYAGWAQQVAKAEGAFFIDLNNLVSARYEGLGAAGVNAFFPTDHTHTNQEGAVLNARVVAEQLKILNPGGISRHLK